MKLFLRTMYNVQRTTLLALVLVTIFFGAGCDVETVKNTGRFPQPANHAVETPEETVAPLSDFMVRRSVAYNDGRVVTFLVAKLSTDDFKWGLAEDSLAPKTVMAWRQELGADLVINGSYFDEMMQATGYYHPAGATSTRIAWPSRDSQSDELSYTGLVQIVNGDLNLFYLPAQTLKESAPDVAAFLTFPTLVADGKTLIKTDSQKYAHRTVLAKDMNGTPYVIITESGSPSLFEMAEWLVAQPERFAIAVNLDGGPSTGMSYADDKIKLEVTSAAVPNVVYLKRADSR
ncbi:MAG: phosphodiester glycosidase family protein [Patescibacteria group bacterium]|nr:phosphodiester glycosidase family protein [Patescibacteria group bacterium]